MKNELHFGTAGIRGLMGPGPGQMNTGTIRIVTQGLANYILSSPKESYVSGVVVCYDCRNHSAEFAMEASRVLAGNGISVHLVPELRPTPFASFAVRYYGAIAGINITASHNPKEYNGYKVYWADGGQVVHPHDEGIIKEVNKIQSAKEAKVADPASPLISFIPKGVDEAYLDAVQQLQIDRTLAQREGERIKIIYSPLNGAGITMIPQALQMWGFTNVEPVEEQKKPDGNFPTTPYPNPETDAALQLGWRDLVQQRADILLVSDPDSDRLSCSLIVKGKPQRLTGNELGALLLHYILSKRNPTGKFATVTTIVSSDLIREMTERHGGTCFEVLTGFKYIGEKIHEWECAKNSYQFLFGMEESLGYLYGTHARDKDATIAACLAAELTLSLKHQRKTLIDQLYALYATYGIHREAQLVIESKSGLAPLVKKMDDLRKKYPNTLGNVAILAIDDYHTRRQTNLQTKTTSPLTLPEADVLTFHFADHITIILRPSGTEPKLKVYGKIKASPKEVHESDIHDLDKQLQARLAEVRTAWFQP